MKTCSIWDWQRLEYDYYSCPGTQSPGGWGPVSVGGAPTAPPGIGQHIEDLLPALPGGCRKVGHGVRARGQIVRPAGGGALGGLGALWPTTARVRWVAGLLVVGAGAWWWARRRGR